MTMTDCQKSLHEKTVECAKRYNACERELLDCLQAVDEQKLYLVMGYSSLFQYCLSTLDLTESQASAMICVMRKALVIPALKDALNKGEINVSRSKRITSVITNENASQWIDKAKNLRQRELEVALVTACPKGALRERISPITPQRWELKISLSSKIEEDLSRAKELARVNSLEETLEKVLEFYLKKNDPLQKEVRSLRNAPRPLQRAIPKSIRNRVLIRDKGQCTHLDEMGNRCGSRKWVEVHHVKPFSEGGDHSLENLATLCYGHHKRQHIENLSAVAQR